MKGRCPVCGTPIAMDQAFAAEAAQELLAHLKALGPRAGLVLEYAEGFRTAPGRPLRQQTAARLVSEVRQLIDEGRFVYDGQEYRIELAAIEAALKDVANRQLTNLKNHNYLKTVMIGLCSKARTAMPKREERGGEGVRGRGGEGGPVAAPESMDVEEIKRFNEQFARIGRPIPQGDVADEAERTQH